MASLIEHKWPSRKQLVALLLLVLLLAGVSPPRASYAGGPLTLTVNSAGDASDLYLGDEVCNTVLFNDVCTLRAALQETNFLAAGGDPQQFLVNLQALAIAPASALPTISSNLYLDGAGAGSTIIDGASVGVSPVLNIASGKTVEIEGVTVHGGTGSGIHNHGLLTLDHSSVINNTSSANGGGIASDLAGATVEVYDSTISGNSAVAGEGGGIYAAAGTEIWLERTTLSGNTAFHGGGLMLYGSGTLVNVTVSGNTASDTVDTAGGGIYFKGSSASETLALSNSTIAGNTADFAFVHSGVAGSMATIWNTIFADNTTWNCRIIRGYAEGYDLDDDNSCHFSVGLVHADARLLPLGNYGGPTQTRALAPGSPAINAGNPSGCMIGALLVTLDQRGVSRPIAGRCDIGAYEAPVSILLPLVLRNWP